MDSRQSFFQLFNGCFSLLLGPYVLLFFVIQQWAHKKRFVLSSRYGERILYVLWLWQEIFTHTYRGKTNIVGGLYDNAAL